MVAEAPTTHFGRFVLEDIDLVQEEDVQCAEEPSCVDIIVEGERFGHPVLWYKRSHQGK